MDASCMGLVVTNPSQSAALQRTPAQREDELSANGVRDFRSVWTHAFGRILIEVREGRAYVDGQCVSPVPKHDGLALVDGPTSLT